MGFIRGEGRSQVSMFPATLDELVPENHLCRVIDAFVEGLAMDSLGFERAEAAETGRPGYDPRDLLKLYLYGYFQRTRSSRRLEAECKRNVELMWLLGRLAPDHKSIAEFRRMHSQAITGAGVELVRLARSVGLIGGEWIGIDGSKFRAASSFRAVRERKELEQYLAEMEAAEGKEEVTVDESAVAAALEKLRHHSEPEAQFMRPAAGTNKVPGYNVQIAVDAKQALIVAQEVSQEANDSRSLLPMAEAARAAVGSGDQPLHVVADVGYSSGEQAEGCEKKGIVTHVPVKRGVNASGDGTLFDRAEFHYEESSDTYLCPAGQRLRRRQLHRKDHTIVYTGQATICGVCALQSRCTVGAQRTLKRTLHEGALQRMQERATPGTMRLRRCLVEHPFATLKCHIFGHPRFLLRGLKGARTEISLAVLVYNLKRMINLLGGRVLTERFATS
jgi:transposase